MRRNYKNGEPDGLYEEWDYNGQLAVRSNYKDGKLDGLYEEWNDNGQLEERINYKDGKLDGLYEEWHDNGQLRERRNYKNGELDGLQEEWSESGEVYYLANYKGGKAHGLVVRKNPNSESGYSGSIYDNGDIVRYATEEEIAAALSEARSRREQDDVLMRDGWQVALEQANARFNEELEQQVNGTLPKGHIYRLGNPSAILQSTGFPNLPIELSSAKLAEKAAQRHHEFEISDVKGLVRALNAPIAVFSYGDKGKAQNVIVEIERDGKKFVIGVHFNQKQRGIAVNDIRGLFPKDTAEWLNWINQGKLLYVDRKRIQDLIDQQRTNLAEVGYLDLDSATKVVENFENPKAVDENLRAEREAELREGAAEAQTEGPRRTEQELSRMAQRAQRIAQRLHLDNVELLTDASQLEGRKARAKGFYTKSTGTITIVLPAHASQRDVEQTLLHEAVAHYGLRQLFGKEFDTFLDGVLLAAAPDVRARIVELARRRGWDFRTATEEYLATLAESMDFEQAQQTSWWGKVKALFLDMLEALGFGGYTGPAITDNELRYILWRSYENLRRETGPMAEAVDISKQYELGVGNFASESADDVLMREAEQYDKLLARDEYERRVRTGWYQTVEAMQDSMRGLYEAYRAVELAKDGKKPFRIEEIPDFMNAYLGENRLSSVNEDEQKAMGRTLFRPLMDEVHRLAHEAGGHDAVVDYMMAKHGLERNEVMARRDAVRQSEQEFKDELRAAQKAADNDPLDENAEADLDDVKQRMADREEELYMKNRGRDYAGLTALTGQEDVPAAEAAAEQMVIDLES